MWDEDDADAAGWAALLISPVSWFGLFLLVAVLVGAWYFASRNEARCEAMDCPPGQSPKLMNHDCLCVSKAVAR